MSYSGGYLSQIQAPDGRVIKYYYTSGDLTSVEFIGTTRRTTRPSLTATAHKLMTAQAYTGHKTDFRLRHRTQRHRSGDRNGRIGEFDGGGQLNFTYCGRETQVTDYAGKHRDLPVKPVRQRHLHDRRTWPQARYLHQYAAPK
jgi:hypothetical protein